MQNPNESTLDNILLNTLNEYYEAYIVNIIELLRKHFSEEEITRMLTTSLTMPSLEFKKYIEITITQLNRKNINIGTVQIICSVLQRMLTGNLSWEDSLMAALLKIAPEKKVADLNILVKEHITIPFLLQKKTSCDEKQVDYTSNNIKNI